MVADPKLIKVILHEDRIIGFILAFPDVSNALRRANGRLLPWSVVDLLREFKRTKLVAINEWGSCLSTRAGWECDHVFRAV